MLKQSAFLLLLLALFSFQCNKDHPPKAMLPPTTQQGKNTVGFMIDNNVWIPYYKCGFGQDPCGEISARVGPLAAEPQGIDFQFGRRQNNKLSALTISSSGIGKVTTIGEKIDSVGINYQGENWTGNTDTYSGIRPGSHFIITKFDAQAQIISGTFELILAEDNGSGKTITLKDGRFDFRFNHCQCSNK